MEPQTVRVMVVDDDEDDYVLLKDLLHETAGTTFFMEWAASFKNGLKEIRKCRHDIYLVDYYLGEKCGLDLLKEAKTAGCKAPIILLTGQGNREVDMAAMAAGASDYLDKSDLRGTILERSIRYALEGKRMEEEILRVRKFESLSILAGGIAHDYNNLLTGVLGYLDLAINDAEPGCRLWENLLEARKSAIGAKDLTLRFLDISKGSAPVFKTGSLGPLIRDCLKDCAGKLDGEMVLTVAEDLGSVAFSQGQMGTVFKNLFSNAYEAMAPGGLVTVAVENAQTPHESEGLSGPGNCVKITVSDHGRGISETDMGKVLDPYFTTKEMGAKKGMGLGLTTAYAILKSHKGSLHIESREGSGTTVTILLPAVGSH